MRLTKSPGVSPARVNMCNLTQDKNSPRTGPTLKAGLKRYILTRAPGPEQAFTRANLVRVRYGLVLSRTKTCCVNTT